jgi:hypothetical protein
MVAKTLNDKWKNFVLLVKITNSKWALKSCLETTVIGVCRFDKIDYNIFNNILSSFYSVLDRKQEILKKFMLYRSMDNVQNCNSYISISSSQTYR